MLSYVRKGGMILLRNEQGAMELRGEDLVLRASEEWLTIYHSTAESSESQSHLHLRKRSFRYARVMEKEGATPFVAFWRTKEEGTDTSPPFAIYFPSFYDWAKDKAPIEENQRLFQEWLEQHGREFTMR
ncbi:hypothetical protein MYX64_11280 [Nitrospinae bacterium AH_259_B05_G02_I21]|nr:hypothetical protein [Nitrospinae bacterium AH_259_B05_G02_I21]